jgi:protocatechuate 3,4-dioxygenase beta subunit
MTSNESPTRSATVTLIHDDHDDHDDHEGLAVDLPLLMRLTRPIQQSHPVQLVGRRKALQLFGGASALALLAACGSTSDSSTSATGSTVTADTTAATTAATTAGTAAATTDAGTTATPATSAATTEATTVGAGAEIPDETGGPFPGDGTNGPNALTEAGVVRQDIRSSFGSSTTTADGVPITFEFTVVEADTGAVLPGASIYLWHCDREGDYSLYANGKTDENYLRGVQTADANGKLSFLSIFPGCYSGRWPHAHFEIYSSIDEATNGRQAVKTTQLALPDDASNEAFATAGYEASVSNFAGMSLGSDNVFSDGADSQIPTMSGNATDGYTATLVVRI